MERSIVAMGQINLWNLFFRNTWKGALKLIFRLKQNPALIALASDKEEDLYQATQKDQISYAVTYGEFMYQAGSWKYPRRVVFKIEKPYGQLTHMYTFIVTNMDMEPYQIIQFYCGRGNPFRKIYHIQTV